MSLAYDAIGQDVPIPAGTDPDLWARICRRVVMLPADGCHLWCGPPRDDGYGQIRVPSGVRIAGAIAKAGPWRAHRLTYSAITGQALDEEQHLMHRCDQPLCCRITLDGLADHQELGDNAANVADKNTKGRGVLPSRWGLPHPDRAARRTQTARSNAIHTVLVELLGIDKRGTVTRPDADPALIAVAVAEAEVAARTRTDWPMLPGMEDLT